MTPFRPPHRALALGLLAAIGAGCAPGESTQCAANGGPCPPDAASADAGVLDAGALDAGAFDAGVLDAGVFDAGSRDAGPKDAGPADSGAPSADAGCVPGALDLPDDLGLDTNCDGIDGDVAQAVFVDVRGDDLLNDGSRALPFATVARALLTGKPQVLVSGTVEGDFTLRAGGVYGGYDSQNAWARTEAFSRISGSARIEADGGAAVLDALIISGLPSPRPGGAAVSLTVVTASSAVVVRHCRLEPAAATSGVAGESGGYGDHGGSPTDGQGPGVGQFDSGIPGPPGGEGASSPCGVPGFAGGAGGDQASPNGKPGLPLDGGAKGGLGAVCLTAPCHGADGEEGPNGVDGLPGAPGLPGSNIGRLAGGAWAPIDGTAGEEGHAGTPGGGGSGGGAVLVFFPIYYWGGSSGGGGVSGGCGGPPGLGGGSGGASIAALVLSGAPRFEDVSFAPSSGGLGAPGGLGGGAVLPTTPGHGGPGTTNGPGITSGRGGGGGFAGQGGAGGPGGPGAGGPAIGLFCAPGSAPTLVRASFTPGYGGPGAAPAPDGLVADTYGCPP